MNPSIASTIERGPMAAVRGIIVHQTGGSTARSSLDSYKSKSANGAHFLIDKDGTIYQTASLHQRTWHVGKLKARCLIQQTCSAAEIKAYEKFDTAGMNKRELAKRGYRTAFLPMRTALVSSSLAPRCRLSRLALSQLTKQ